MTIVKSKSTEIVLTGSAADTNALGHTIGSRCTGGEILMLIGGLGAGKTTFVKGLAQGMGIEEQVTSPSFVLMNLYEGPFLLCHFDLYRLTTLEDVETIGIWEYAGDEHAVVVIEWADMLVESGFPPPYTKLCFDLEAGENNRKIEIEHIE